MTEKKRNPFKLGDFRGIHPDVIAALDAQHIKNADQLLNAGRTRQQRASLAKATGIPEDAILELVKLADLARLPGVKGIRARLYYDAGVDSGRQWRRAGSQKPSGNGKKPHEHSHRMRCRVLRQRIRCFYDKNKLP